MREKAYVVRKAHGGYGVFELGIVENRVVSEMKLVEYDFLVIAISKLSAYLASTCPEQKIYKKPLPDKDEALPVKDEISTETEVKK